MKKFFLIATLVCFAFCVTVAIIDFSLKSNASDSNSTDGAKVLTQSLTEFMFPERQISLLKGKSLTLQTINTPFKTELVWESSDPSVATVTQSGVVKGVGYGNATITCRAKDNEKTYAVTNAFVYDATKSISLHAAEKIEIGCGEQLGKTVQLKAEVSPSTAQTDSFVWSSSDPSVASVDENGMITSVSEGSATISVQTLDGTQKYADCKVTVSYKYVKDISLPTNKVFSVSGSETAIGNSITLTPVITPSDAYNGTVAWSSSDSSVATVSNNGVVTSVGGGVAVITAQTTDGTKLSASTNVSVRTQALPNIYYFILDEYGSFNALKKYYDYDNATLRDFFEKNNFNISDYSFSYTKTTGKCFLDIVTLNYSSKKSLSSEKMTALRKNSALISAFKELGYSQYQVASSANFFYVPYINSSSVLKGLFKTVGDDGQSTLSSAVQSKLLSAVPYSMIQNRTAGAVNAFKFWKLDETYEMLNNDEVFLNPTVIYSYICMPHVPFAFAADGTKIHGNARNWQDPKYYLGQLQYATNQMLIILQNILKDDPGCIIIVQSDHGVRYHGDGTPPHTFKISYEDQRNILNAVYYSGKELDIEGLSAPNTLRLILRQFGLDYPQIEDPMQKYIPDSN